MITSSARLVSNILNPFLVSFTVIAVLAFESTATTTDAFKWLAIAMVLSVLPVLAFVIYMVRTKKLDGIFINPREQRNRIYPLAALLGVAGAIIMYAADAPELLFVTFVTGLAAVVIFMTVNLWWKISLHTGFIAAAVAIIIMVFGVKTSWIALAVPLVGWARLEMKLHTWQQVTAGAVLAAAVTVVFFLAFGITGE